MRIILFGAKENFVTSKVFSSQANIIECEEITVIRDNKEILCAASCCVPRNSLTFLVGENGTGKTTLVQTMLGILPQREGKISVHSLNREKVNIGYVPQSIEFPKQLQLTVAEYLRYVSNLDTEDIHNSLKTVDFPLSHLRKTINQLSGGQRQKLLLAAELSRKPDILFLDEPLSNVDDTGEKHILDVILEIKNKGVTIILITHDWQMVSTYADHVICLNKNFLCEQGTSCICKNSLSKVNIKQIQKITPDPLNTHDGYCYIENV